MSKNEFTKGPIVVEQLGERFFLTADRSATDVEHVGITYKQSDAILFSVASDLLAELDVRVGDLVMLRRAIDAGDPKAELLLRVDDMLRETRAAIAKAGA